MHRSVVALVEAPGTIRRHLDGPARWCGGHRITTGQADIRAAPDHDHAEASGIKPEIQQSMGVFGVNQNVNGKCAVNIEIPPSACGKMMARRILRDLTVTEPERYFGNYNYQSLCPRVDSVK
ncbi:MAG TPA: hypothetical protein VF780_03265 [Nitrosospira sp.]